MKTINIIRTLVVIVAVFGIVVAGNMLYKKSQSDNALPYYSVIPQFEFITQDSIPFGLNDLKGKISVVDFMFTRCKGPCPIMSNLMGELYQHFDNVSNVQFVSISVDPEYDSLLALQNYAKLQGVDDNRWVFLSASMADVVNLCENGFKLSADDLPGAHSTKFIIVDPDGHIRGYYSGIEKESVMKLQNDIEGML